MSTLVETDLGEPESVRNGPPCSEPPQNRHVLEMERRLRQIPQSQQALLRRCFQGKAGKALRLKAKCLDCCCYQKIEVRDCTAVLCPLWSVRPYQKKHKRLKEKG